MEDFGDDQDGAGRGEGASDVGHQDQGLEGVTARDDVSMFLRRNQ